MLEKKYTLEEVEIMNRNEIKEIENIMLDRYYEEFDSDDYETCYHCPLEDVCGECELYWGCGVWEESMGDDLQNLPHIARQ